MSNKIDESFRERAVDKSEGGKEDLHTVGDNEDGKDIKKGKDLVIY